MEHQNKITINFIIFCNSIIKISRRCKCFVVQVSKRYLRMGNWCGEACVIKVIKEKQAVLSNDLRDELPVREE